MVNDQQNRAEKTTDIRPAGQAAPGAPRPQATARPAAAQAARPSRRPAIVIAILCAVAAVAVWLAVWLFACNGSSLFDPDAQTGQAPYKTQEEMQAELDRVVEEGMFNISIASAIQFADGASPGTAYIENVPGNHYLMKVSIVADATGEQLYESGVLQPNQFIEDVVLARDLEPGTYDATATFLALDPTTYEEVGQAAAKITLSVQG